jgi:polyphosphate kinase
MVLMRKNQQNLNLMVFHIIFKRNNNDIIVTKLILFKLNTTIQTKYINSLYAISLRHVKADIIIKGK